MRREYKVTSIVVRYPNHENKIVTTDSRVFKRKVNRFGCWSKCKKVKLLDGQSLGEWAVSEVKPTMCYSWYMEVRTTSGTYWYSHGITALL